MKRTALRVLMVAGGGVCIAWGKTNPGNSRGVACISLRNGDVSVRRADSGEAVAAARNAPLVVQDQLLSGPDNRPEMQPISPGFWRRGPQQQRRWQRWTRQPIPVKREALISRRTVQQ